jgi:Flp pilus assembly protein TadD
MAVSHGRTERFYLKLLLGAIIGIIFVIALFWAGHDLYLHWQEKRLVRRAMSDLERGDERDAGLAARTILGMKPSSASAARIMAELAERRGERSALVWRHKVAQLAPHSVHDALALARCALQFNNIATAKQTLDAVDQSGRNSADFHAGSALLAQATGDDEKADQEWSEAIRLAPQDKSHQLQLGMLRLRSKEAERHGSGEAMLTALRADPAQRVPATRALIVDGAARHIDNNIVLTMARELQAYPEATFNEQILYLDILRQLPAADFPKHLTKVEQDAVSNPVNLAALISWLQMSGLSLVAIDFARNLGDENLNKWPVPLALAEAYAKLHDWAALATWVKDKDWGQFEFMRHAYLARALRGQNNTTAADKEWGTATKEAAAQPRFLSMLTRTTSEWRWEKEWLELLWNLTKYPETQLEALQNLYRKYSDDSNAPGLYRVLVRLVELIPEDERLQNNLAQLCLLLDADVERGRKLATELYRKEGSNPAYVTTYAFALHVKGDTKGGLRAMNALSEDQLRDPSVAAYYGVLLAATGEAAKAREYLNLATSAKLLPEEKALVTKAENSLK